MLNGFLEAVLDGSYQGKYSTYIAMGVQFLRNMIVQSNHDLDRVKSQEKEMFKRSKEAIAAAGGNLNGKNIPEEIPNNGSPQIPTV